MTDGRPDKNVSNGERHRQTETISIFYSGVEKLNLSFEMRGESL